MVSSINEEIHGKRDNTKKDNGDVKENPFAWAETIDILSKEFNLSWGELTTMNIYAFNYRVKVLGHLNNKKLKQQQEQAAKAKARIRR